LQHLRPLLGESYLLQAGEMAWFGDATPHESLPLDAGTKRQFFRLVGFVIVEVMFSCVALGNITDER
jgi:hypothetical protein